MCELPEHVLDHFEDPYHEGACPRVTHRAQASHPLCGHGDRMQIELEIDGQRMTIVQAWFEAQGCRLSLGAASLLVESIEGMSVDELRRQSVNEMLQILGPEIPADQQKCGLLAWRTLQLALDSPVDPDRADSDSLDHQSFNGPHLGDET